MPASAEMPPPLCGAAAPWVALEQLLQQLDSCKSLSGQIQITLDAVRKATAADMACWYTSGPGECVTSSGEAALAAAACQAFVRDLVAKMPADGSPLLWRRRQDGEQGAADQPQSAAAVRVSKSSSNCLIALRFHAQQALQTNDVRLMILASRLLLKHHSHRRVREQLKDTLLGTLQCLTVLIEAKDTYTCGHSERVGRIAMLIGEQMDLPEKVISDLHLAGLLHDIGKIGIRDEVLLKSGALTPEETAHIREHVVIGDRVVSQIKHFAHLSPGVRSHHERYDGEGYPDGLAGEDIPLLGRVLAVGDGVDAMMSPRRYRPAFTPPQIDEIMKRLAGKQWDPQVVEGFLGCRREIYPPIYQKGIGESAYHAIGHAIEGTQESSALFRLDERD